MNRGLHNSGGFQFKCFQHPTKNVEAICTEPVCNHYRFFCVTCFLEHSSHFINHKNQIFEVQEFLQSHQNSLIRTAGVQEIDGMLDQISQFMKEYEILINQKQVGYQNVFKEIEKLFDEAKKHCLKEVQDYLQLLISKQQAHYTYLKKKIDVYKQDLNFIDFKQIHKHNEQETTFFFENIIKNQFNQHKEFKNEVKMYTHSFQRNIHELDNINSSNVVDLCVEEMRQIIKDKFNDLREVLIVPNSENMNSMIKNSKIKNESSLFGPSKSTLFNLENMTISTLQQKTILNGAAAPIVDNNQSNNFSLIKHNNNNMNNVSKNLAASSFMENNNHHHHHHSHSNNNNNQKTTSLLKKNQTDIIMMNTNSDYIDDSASAYNRNKSQIPNTYPNVNYFQNSSNSTINHNHPYIQSSNVFQEDQIPISKPNKNKRLKIQQQQIDSEIEVESENEYNGIQSSFPDNQSLQSGKQSNRIYQTKNGVQYYQQQFEEQNKPEIFQKPQPKQMATPTHTEGITQILLYDDIEGKKIISTGSLDKQIMLWYIVKENLEHIKTLKGHQYPITCMCNFQKEDQKFIASGDMGHEIKIWNPSLSRNELITTLHGHMEGGITSLLYQNGYLISSSKDSTIKIWCLDELKCLQTIKLENYSSYIASCNELLIATSVDGFRIYQFNDDKSTGNIYKLKSYNNKAHRSGIQSICEIKYDGIDLATSGKDGLIKLWDMSKGQCVRQLKQHSDCVYDMIFFEDKLFSSGRDGLKVWEMDGTCLLERQNNHRFVKDDNFGQIIIIQEHEYCLSVGNGDNIIKIVPL